MITAPTDISNLLVWCDNQSGIDTNTGFEVDSSSPPLITLWNDRSGNGNHPTPAAGAYNPTYYTSTHHGGCMLSIGGSNGADGQYMDVPGTISDRRNCTIMIVMENRGTQNNYFHFYNSVDEQLRVFTVNPYMYFSGSSTARMQCQKAVYLFRANSSTGRTFWLNESSVTPGGALTLGSTTGLRLGGNGTGTVQSAARYYALCVYNKSLTDNECTDLRNWAYKTFDIIPSPKLNLVLEGDSLTYGTFATRQENYIRQAPGLKHRKMYNLGLDAYQAWAMDANYATRVGAYYDASADLNVMVLLAGYNDTWYGGVKTSDEIIASLQSILTKAKTTGYKTVLCTELTDGGGGDRDTKMNAVNTYARAGSFTNLDRLCDIRAHSALSTWNSTYYASGIHPNTLGYGIMGQMIGQSVASLYNGRRAAFAA